jgi:hypothetical protein
MKRALLLICFLILTITCLVGSFAQPVAITRQTYNKLRIYQDFKNNNVYYFEPPDYILAKDDNGKPEFKMIKMRYTGTRASGDNETFKYSNLLQFKIITDRSIAGDLNELKKMLKSRTRTNVQLKPLPVSRFETILVFSGSKSGSSANTEKNDSTLKTIKGGFTEVDENSLNTSWFDERTFSLRLTDDNAQLIEKALNQRQEVINMYYAFYSAFSSTGMDELAASKNGRYDQSLMNYFEGLNLISRDTLLKNMLVKAGVTELNLNINEWPGLIETVDINEKLPPKYPLFDVYCYDFNNSIRPDLFSKKVEIKAISVNGSEITVSRTFKQTQPDIYAFSVRFPYAVRFDRPFKYRVTEISNDGEKSSTDWIERSSWNEIIDITGKSIN